MMLLNIMTELHNNLISVSLNPLKYSLRQKFAHGNDLDLCNGLLIDPVVVLQGFNIGFLFEEIHIKHDHLSAN